MTAGRLHPTPAEASTVGEPRVDRPGCPLCRFDAAPDVELGGYQLFHCERCGLRFAPHAFQVPVDYDRVYQSAEYETVQVQALQELDAKALGNHPTYRAFFRQVRHRRGARLLDVGCGVGRFGQGAYARGWDVTGVDVSARAVAIGREVAPFPLRVGTVEQLIEQGEQYDVVTAFEVLEHLSDPLRFLSNTKRLLRPGGQLFYTVPNWNCAVVQNSTRPDWVPPIHLLFFTREALHRAGELSGLGRVATGIISEDPLPTGAVPRARWLARRLLRRSRAPVGLWMHGWLPA
jgi:SAM-dependent methyltransferase